MRKHENQATSKTQPWLRARPIRQCETCGRDLPRRAFRKQCATCIKQERAIFKLARAWAQGAA